MLKSSRFLLLTIFCLVNIHVFSQQEYTSEIGIHGGGSYFLGDVNLKLLDIQPDFGLLYRYIFNPRIALQADFNHTMIAGDYTQRNSQLSPAAVRIDQNINALDFSFAFNFFDYVKYDYVMKSSNHTLYIFLGVGLAHLHANTHQVAASLPIGLGYKFKLANRLHLNVQATHRLMLDDNLEGNPDLNNALGLNGTNVLNNDHLGTFTIGLSYSMFKKKCDCLNYK